MLYNYGVIAAYVLPFLVLTQQAQKPLTPTDQNVIGEWKAVTSSFKFELSEAGKADLKKQGDKAQSEFKVMMDGVRKEMASLLFTFSKDHSYKVTADSKDQGKGKWTLKGADVKITMDEPDGSVPTLTLSKDLKKIQVKFNIPELGAGSFDLEPAKKTPTKK